MYNGRPLRDTFATHKFDSYDSDRARSSMSRPGRTRNDDDFGSDRQNGGRLGKSFVPTGNLRDSSYPDFRSTNVLGQSGIYDDTNGTTFKVDDRRFPGEMTNWGFSDDENSDETDDEYQRKTNYKNGLSKSKKKTKQTDIGKSRYESDNELDDKGHGIGKKMGWRTLVLSQDARNFYEDTFKKIPLRLNNNRKGSDFSRDFRHDDSEKFTYHTEDNRCNRKTVMVIAVLVTLLLIIIATPLIVVLVLKADDTTSTTTVAPTAAGTFDEVVVNMQLTLNESFNAAYTNTSSEEYQNFTTEFCNEITGAYQNSTYRNHSIVCEVTNVTEGSIIVSFTIRIRGYVVVTDEAIFIGIIIQFTITISDTDSKLGRFLVIRQTVIIIGKVNYVTTTTTAGTTTSISTTAVTTQETTTQPDITTSTSADTTTSTLADTTTTNETGTFDEDRCTEVYSLIGDVPFTDPSAVVVNMQLKLNENFTSGLSDNSSEEYKNFTTDFCNEITGAYQNSTYSNHSIICEVTNVTEGSIIVSFTIRIRGYVVVTDEAIFIGIIIQATITISDTDSKLGRFLVIRITVIIIGKVNYVTTTTTAGTTTSISTTAVTTQETTTQPDITTSTSADTTTSTLADTTTTSETGTFHEVVVNMQLKLNESFTSGLSDNSTEEYKNFTTDFCNEITGAYQNSTYRNHSIVCEVTNVTEGSIIVSFTIRIRGYVVVTDEAIFIGIIIQSTITISDTYSKLGRFLVIRKTVIIIGKVNYVTTTTTAGTTTSISTTAVTTQETTTQPDITTSTSADTTTSTLAETTTTNETNTTTSTVTDSPTSVITDTSTSAVTDSSTSVVTDTSTSAVTDSSTSVITDTTTSVETTSTEAVTTISSVVNTTTSTVADTTTSTVTETTTSTVADIATSTAADTTTSTVADTATSTVADTTTSTATATATSTVADTPTSTVADTTTSTVADTATSTVADTTTSTAAATVAVTPSSVVDTTTSTIADTTTSTVTETTTSTVADITTLTAADTTTSTVADTTTSTVADTTTSTVTDTATSTVADTTTSTVTDTTTSTAAVTTTSTVVDTTTSSAADTTTSIVADTTTSTVADTTTSTVTDTTTSTVADITTSTEADTTTSTVADTTTSTVTDTTTSTVADTTTSTVADTTTSTVADTTTSTVADTTSSVTETSYSTTVNTTTMTTESTTTAPPTTTVKFSRESHTFNVTSPAEVVCQASYVVNWTSIEIFKTTGGSETLVLRKYKSGTPKDDEPLKTRVGYSYEITDTSLNVTLKYSQVACNDNGTYKCVVNTTSTSLSDTSTVSVIRYPSEPVLTIHSDQIINMGFHRGGFEHECKGEVGYPHGSLSVVYKQKNQGEFVAFPANKVIYYPNATEGDCSKVESLKFGLNFTEADDGAEIKCVTRNDQLDIIKESLAQSLELIPRNYCVGRTDRYRYHPINCHKFVDCADKDYPVGNKCPVTDTCVTNIANAVCGDCDVATCPKTNDPSVTTTTAVPVTTTTPEAGSLYILTADTSTFLRAPSIQTFNISKSQFEYLNLTRTPSNTGVKSKVADVSNDGTVTVHYVDGQLAVSYASNVVSVKINQTKCSDEGKFEATVKGVNESYTAASILTLKAKPETPTLNLHPDLVENFPRLGSEHTCTGNVGYPGGSLKIEISTKADATNYSVPVYLGGITNSDPVREDCTNKATFKFLLNLGMEWNGGMIKCTAENEKVLSGSDVPPYVTERMDIIESKYCTGESENAQKPVLNTCDKFVICSNGNPYGKTCIDQCYDSSKLWASGMPCSDCSSVYCSANPTTTAPTTTLGTTTPLPDANSVCTSAKGYIGSTVNFTCTINGDFTSVNITKGSNVHLADAIPTTGVVLDNTGDQISVSYDSSGKKLEVKFTNLKCTDDSTYSVRTNGEGTTHLAETNIEVISKVDEKPQLTVPLKIIEDQTASFHCAGETGLPAGAIYLEIKQPSNGDYKNMSDVATVTTTKSVNQTSCNTRTDFTYKATMNMTLNDSSIRCVTKQGDSADQVSDLGVLQVVSKDICSEYNSTVTAVKYHPYTCGKWITCHQGSILMNACGNPAAPCIKITPSGHSCLDTCDHC